MFDLGDIAALSAREIVRTSHVFVSHMHMDHFSGFDRLLRLNLYQPRAVHLFGPPGLVDAVEAKLRAYTWNLLGPHSADFVIIASDWANRFERTAHFRAQSAFTREDHSSPPWDTGILHKEADFSVEGAVLDHGIPCLAFAFQESRQVKVHKATLNGLGLPVGPWLSAAKTAIRNQDLAASFDVAGALITVGDLLERGGFSVGPGQRIAYATDFGFTPANIAAATALVANANQLFIEAGFLHRDAPLAGNKNHLTARQAGEIAYSAGARRAIPMHFSARHLGQEAELRAEFASAARVMGE
jgi:ribonuclease Z